MAKENKKAALSMEERLDAALVPDWEQPYKVPANWCWTTVKTLCTLINGRAFKPADWSETGLPIVRIQNLNNPEATYNYYSGIVDPAHMLKGQELLFAWSGTPGTSFGAHIWWGNEAVLNQHIFKVLFDERCVDKTYLKYAINQQLEWLISVAHGGAGLQHVTKGVFESTPIPLPPYAEQQRIVDRIESLFAKLDEAKEKAQEVVDGYDAHRAAILHKAFTGELTAEWRIINGIGNDSWKTCKFDDCIDVMQNGLAKREGYSGEPFVVLRLANLSEDGFDETDLREIVLDEKEQKSYELHSDDVLMVRVNGSKDNVGKQYQVTNQKRWAFCDHIIRIRYANNVLPQYMVYFSKSSKYRQYIKDNMVSTAGQNTISRKGMARLQVPVPMIDEQAKIASILTDLFEKEQQAIEASKQVIDQIDTMKKAILARAFRGELGTNDLADENAVELLKETLNIEKTPTKRAKAITIPKELSANLKTELEKRIVKLFYQKDTKELPIKDIMTVSSKTFDVLDCLRSLEQRQLITKLENGKYRLMG